MTPWSVPGFSTEARREELRRVDERIRREGPLRLELPGFVLVAVKRG
jgi:hypothetical protein